jgi:SAM-dependent methyltransferase
MSNKEWFAQWFDSSYYHILYQERDHTEAEQFMSRLMAYLKPSQTAQIVDLACGKGRHAIYLNKLGYQVTGVDLSQQSIAAANEFQSNTLSFEVKDLRKLDYHAEFDLALNLFTSFGYFDSFEVNVQVLEGIHQALKPNGLLLIDFFNCKTVLENLVPSETKHLSGIQFHIEKKLHDHTIVKDIRFTDKGQNYHYQEKVQALSQFDFIDMLQQTGFEIQQTWGNYNLIPFDENNAERLIILAGKKHA